MLPLEKRQHVDQFKAPVDIRRAARPAELIALRAPGAEFPSSPGPGAYLSRLPKCAY